MQQEPNHFKRNKRVEDLLVALLFLLFAYTAITKLWHFRDTVNAMHNQIFPFWVGTILAYLVPALELWIAISLILGDMEIGKVWYKGRLWGLRGALISMEAFTLYVGLVLVGLFPRVPCSCGGVVKKLGWGNHFWFNIAFLIIAAGAVRLYRRRNETHTTPLKFSHQV